MLLEISNTFCGHELLTIILRFAPILVSTLDPTSRFSSLGKEETIAAVRTGAVRDAGLVLNQNDILFKKDVVLIFTCARSRVRT